jgi:Glycosyl hydrolases family 11
MKSVPLAAAALVMAAALNAHAAYAETDSAMAIAQSAPTPMIEEKLPTPPPGATFTKCFPDKLKAGHAYLALWSVGDGYTAETWFSQNFKGDKSCLTTFGSKSFQIDWDMKVYGFLHEVGLYNLSIKVDDISPDVKGRHEHELRNISGGGGYTGLYGWFGKAGTPESIELYINDNWAGEKPNMGDCIKLGSIDIDGGTYEIWTRPRKGKRFAQFWSNRTTQRTSGEISYAKHFEAWRKLGLPNIVLTRLTFAFEVRWGQPGTGTAHYKSFSIDKPVSR